MSATFTATPVIWVHVEDSGDARFMERFLGWLVDEGPVKMVAWQTDITRSSKSINVHAAGFAPDDAERVIAWLRGNGCEERRNG